MNLLFISFILAIICLALFAFKKLTSKATASKNIEVIPVFDIMNNGSDLRAYLTKRTIESNKRFLEVHMPGRTGLIIKDAETAKIVLSQPEEYPKTQEIGVPKIVHSLVIPSVISSNGQEWRRYRDVLSHPFHFDQVKLWIDDFDQIGLKMLNIWATQTHDTINIAEWMSRFTIDILGKTVFQTDFGALKGEKDEAAKAVGETITSLSDPINLLAGTVEKYTGHNFSAKSKENYASVRKLFSGFIEDRKNNMKPVVPGEKPNILDVMMQSDANLSFEELFTNLFILFVAGFDTTATALSFLMYYLGLNPEIQQRARDEVNSVLKGKNMTANDLRSYLTAVIKEGMRIQPPASLIPSREAGTDLQLDDVFIKKGTPIWLSIYGIHHDPVAWPNPDKFDPNRFIEKSEANNKRHPFSYMPFSMKSRAWYEMLDPEYLPSSRNNMLYILKAEPNLIP